MARILLVEDDAELSGTLQMVLGGDNHTVTAVLGGVEGMEQARYGEFDLIVLDGYLPEISGLEICRTYRQEGGTAPVLMLTGQSDPKSKQGFIEAGASDYLMKPFGIKDLLSKVSALLSAAAPPCSP